jgi:GntR family transcriptional regulator
MAFSKAPFGKPDDPRPIYVQIMESLRRQILSGQIRERLMSEIGLAQQLGTSRGTVKQAISGLVHEGFLHRHRGLGTFVNADQVERYYQEISSFTGTMKAQGLSPTVRLLRFDRRKPEAKVAEALRLAPNEEIYYYSRVVQLRDEPIVLTDSHIPAGRFPGLEIDHPGESLYKILRQGFGATPIRARDTYTPGAAIGQVAEALRLPEGVPVFHVERIATDASGQALELALSWFSKGRLTIEISPMSLFLEEQFFSDGAAGQWHHQVVTEY